MHPEKNKIKQCFNRGAQQYDHAAHVQTYVADNLLAKLSTLALTPKSILDLGTGTGYCILPLQAHFPQALVLGIDLAFSMCLQAQQKTTAPILCMDFDALAFVNGSFNLITSSLALQWSMDVAFSLGEIHAALAPHGYFVFATLTEGSLKELAETWQHFDKAPPINSFLSIETLEARLSAAGFELIQTTYEHKKFNYESALAVLRSLKAVGANHVFNKKTPGLTPKKLLHLETIYPRCVNSQQCPLSYEIAYIFSRKKNAN